MAGLSALSIVATAVDLSETVSTAGLRTLTWAGQSQEQDPRRAGDNCGDRPLSELRTPNPL